MDKEESVDKYLAAQRRYFQSNKGRRALKRYLETEKGKASVQRYVESEKFKASQLKYRMSEKGQKQQEKQRAAAALSKFLKANPNKTVKDFWELFVVREGENGQGKSGTGSE